MPRRIVEERLIQFIADDVGEGDVTASAIIPEDLTVKAEVIAKADGVVAGLEEATILAEMMDLKVDVKAADGDKVKTSRFLWYSQATPKQSYP
jgi:Nicotinate-nucleotide pyrophosphorylase